jgi:hypothetical protein
MPMTSASTARAVRSSTSCVPGSRRGVPNCSAAETDPAVAPGQELLLAPDIVWLVDQSGPALARKLQSWDSLRCMHAVRGSMPLKTILGAA